MCYKAERSQKVCNLIDKSLHGMTSSGYFLFRLPPEAFEKGETPPQLQQAGKLQPSARSGQQTAKLSLWIFLQAARAFALNGASFFRDA
jgi:hypothetical protein